MYAAIRKYQGDPSSADEIARRAQEGFVPLISSMPGFVAYYGINAGNGTIVTVSVFEDQAAAEESSRRAASWVRENLASLLPNPPEITAGEVTWGSSPAMMQTAAEGTQPTTYTAK